MPGMHAPLVQRGLVRLVPLALAVVILATLAPSPASAITTRMWPGAGREVAGRDLADRELAGRATRTGTSGESSTPSAIVPGTVNRSSLQVSATYAVDARLAVAARTLRGSVTITARNDSGAGIDRLRLNTVMGPLGRLSLGRVTVDGRAVKATRSDQTITVPLGGVLPAGESVTLVVPFAATLRSTTTASTWLFTRANGITSMYRWVPWISRTTTFARPNFGDPFVTPVSPRATLRLRTDVPLKVVVNGRRTSISADGRTTTWVLDNVRDIVVNAARDYRTRARNVGDTAIRVYTRPGQPSAALMDAAVNAVTKLEAKLGPYPWPVLRIVQSSGGLGMEGPGVVWIPAGVQRSNLRYLLMHEIAHQWFYGLVGNDQAREPFADEAITDMVARYLTGTRRGSRCTTGALDRTIYAYSAGCYYERIYIQGGNLLDNARRTMGTTAFFRALRGYLADHRWGLVHTRTLLDALDAATPLDLARGWRSRFPTLY
jgi:aminopeptidase N